MKKSAFISDIFFAFFTAFIFSLCLFRYLRVGLTPSLLLAFLCGLLISAFTWAVLSLKRKKLFLKRSDEEKKQKLLLHLSLLAPKQATELFASLLEGKYLSKRLIATKTELFFISLSFASVTADEIAEFFRQDLPLKKTVYCRDIEASARALCATLNIFVKTENDIYLLFKEKEGFPAEFLGDTQKEKLPFFKRKAVFAKANSNRFFISGSLLLLSSLITPFPYYYLIFGSILLLTATITRIFGHE